MYIYIYIYIYIYVLVRIYLLITLMSRVFATGSRTWGSIPGQIITMTQKMVLVTSLLNTQYSDVKFRNLGKGVATSATP